MLWAMDEQWAAGTKVLSEIVAKFIGERVYYALQLIVA